MAHIMYQFGDGFGVQDRKTRDHILINLLKPITWFIELSLSSTLEFVIRMYEHILEVQYTKILL